MYSQNHAPWAQPGPANQMPQGPGSTQQPWGQQQQQSQPTMQSNTQFPGFHSGPSGQQLWNGGQQNSANPPANQASGQPWTPGLPGGPEQQPQNFPPYYQQQQQQAQQQPQQNNQPQFGQSPQQGQQHFHNQQPNMPSGAAPWGGQQNQPWQQQGPPQQQPMLQQQISGPQGMPGPKVITAHLYQQANLTSLYDVCNSTQKHVLGHAELGWDSHRADPAKLWHCGW